MMRKQHIHILGQTPAGWQKALTELQQELGYVSADDGIEIQCVQGNDLRVESDGRTVTLTWAAPVQFYRALSLIPQPLAACSVHEKARFETCGVMFDCSRNAVLKPEGLRYILRKMALMGLNMGMMYTEDTYEVPEQPFFGYKRGRYSYDELKALDDYADLFGIELCPCIQTLGHLKRILHWPAFHSYRDNDEVLLADDENTYVLLDQMIRAATAPYRSKRIHLGMDEAFGVGLGAHLVFHGYEDPHSVIGRHLKRVLEITDKYGLSAMMWSDMYFHLDGRNYHSEGLPSQKAKDAVDPRITLMYWDYYQSKEEMYADALYKHAQFPAPTVFAGGIWTWIGPAPDYPVTFANTVAGLTACMKAGVPLVLATAWGDNGGEANMTAALLGMQLYGEMTYTGVYDDAALRARFARCCNADAQAFWDISLLNSVPGMVSYSNDPCNACKFLLYQDPLVPLFEADLAGVDMAAHYEGLAAEYRKYQTENPEFALLMGFYARLAEALTVKCRFHQLAGPAVRAGDRETAARCAMLAAQAKEKLETLRLAYRALWYSTNKTYGFEILDLRLGGCVARMDSAEQMMRDYAAGTVDTVASLAEEPLPYTRLPDGALRGSYAWNEIVSACKIDL